MSVTVTGPVSATVLVADGAEATRRLLSERLSEAGHRVVGATTGAEALGLLDDPDALPHLAVVGVRLPDMSGFEVCESIKGNPVTAAIPVVHVADTAIKAADRAEGLNRGADAFLTEPVAADELLATVEAALRNARARHEAERLAERLTGLTSATIAVHEAPRIQELADAAARGAGALVDAPAAAFVVSLDGGLLYSLYPKAPGRPGPGRVPPDLLHRFLRDRFGDRVGADSVIIPAGRWRTTLYDPGRKADVCLIAARTRQDRPPVCLAVPANAVDGAQSREMLVQLAYAAAQAAEAIRSYGEEHYLALTLQRSFLPRRLPVVPGVEIAVRYLPASDQAEIGGDFYGAVELDGQLLVAIGDVAGHSLAAATAMVQLRHSLLAYALEGHGPENILERLDRMLARFQGWATATMCLVLVDPAEGRLRIANAGHIPPLLLPPDAPARYADVEGPLLGLELPRPPATELRLDPRGRLLLVTDGLVESRDVDLDTSLEQLRAAATSGPKGIEYLCDALLERFSAGQEDDIALLAVRLPGGGRSRP